MPTSIAAAALTDISATSVLLVVVNLLIALAVAIIGWSLKRLVTRNDEEHSAADGRIEKLIALLSKEGDMREKDIKTLDGKIYRTDINVAENVAKKSEVMRMYGTLTRSVNEGFTRLSDKIDKLPCKNNPCAAQENP